MSCCDANFLSSLMHVVSWYFESDLWTDIVYPSHSITVYHQRHFKSAVSSLHWEEIFGRVPIFNDRYHWCSTQPLDVTGPVGQLEQPKEWPEAKTHQSVSQSPIRHGFLHRIDVPCSGLVLLAKTYEAFYATQLQLGRCPKQWMQQPVGHLLQWKVTPKCFPHSIYFWMWRCTVFGSSFWSLWKTFNGYPISTSTSIAYQRCYPGKPC